MKFSRLDKLKAAEGRKPEEPAKAPEAAPRQPETPAAPPPAQAPSLPQVPAAPPPAPRPVPRFLRGLPEPAKKEPPFRELDSQAKKIYARLLEQSAELLARADQPYTEQFEAVRRCCFQVADALKKNPVLLNYSNYSTRDNYLVAHTANSTIVALAMGLAASLDGPELELLGFCAMAHDIGMTGYSHLFNSTSPLSEAQFAELAQHVEDSVRKLDRIVDLDYKVKARAKRVVLQVHERLDGAGYPDHRSSEEIDPLAQFIGIADAYEALTHPRPWRAAISGPEAVKQLVEKEGRGFNAKAIKALIAAVTIYPPGSLVQLSTRETARVLKLNKGSITRPLVELLLDKQGLEMKPAELDLIKLPLTSIERGMTLAEIAKYHPDLAAKLEQEQWWAEPL